MSVFIIFVVGNPLVRMHHIHQTIALIAILGPASDLIRNLQNTPTPALYLKYIAQGRNDPFQPLFSIGKA